MREIVVKSCILFLSQEAALLEIILSICICTVVCGKENAKPTLQEVIRGQTPHIIPEMESWLIQELLGHTPMTDDFY